MSWFKNTAGDNPHMSTQAMDSKSSQPATPPRNELRSSFDRAAFERAALETKAALEAKVKAPAEVKPAVEAKPLVSVFGASLRFKGELRADEDFTLQGRIEGSIHHSQNLTIGSDGFVKGDSRARNIIVDGTIDGDLYALESIAIRPTAKVQGNLMAPRVSIADGASFNGKIDMATAARAARSSEDRQAAAPVETAAPPERATEQVLVTGAGGA